ncbi:MAG: membrane trafficking protein [Clostridia bacterium]|nr:membrane trafficking protein [Clostridia bacterium]
MNEQFRKQLADIVGKMDEKVLQAKLNAAMDMLKKGNTEELARKLNKMDKVELVQKINEFDESKLKEMNINVEELKQKITPSDLDRLSVLLGDQGHEIVEKIKSLLNKK